jgi:hypothetical protein
MLTVIYTWTCCICGAVQSQPQKLLSRSMLVMNAEPPENWQWVNHHMLVCDQHRVVVQDKEQG